ncbi:aromatic peroxygenase precursor [Pholiota conissans]|uniref:Aromatic peroxygenase n=1 Tax=Pholiota conissans TaxID=109636 RepID=A0A9P5Z0Y7_9AGAR|nr:aromatic peroxygenase precursor [Pholiota conissans]
MTRLFLTLLLPFALSSHPTSVSAFPSYSYRSLAGLSTQELQEVIPSLTISELKPPPGPLKDTSAILVNDELHPWKPTGKDDMRGPCPGLNTLASHGWLPRNGIASPSQIITAVQEGFNMGNDLAIFVTYAAHLVDGNLLTDLLSIGGKSLKTGPSPPAPAIVGGLNTHGVFEGDASMTRGDDFFGDNHSFNETLFDELVEFSNKFGGGFYNLTAAAEFRWHRIQSSISTNPIFSLTSPRYYTAYAESVFPLTFFVDGRRSQPRQLDIATARGFFEHNRMPHGFFRSNTSWTLGHIGGGMDVIWESHPVLPGRNNGTINSYEVDPDSADFTNFCKMYTDFVNVTVKGLYPNPKGALLKALKTNLDYFYTPIRGRCEKVPVFTDIL